METTRERMPSATRLSCASTARLTSLPDAMMITCGTPPGASASTYAPCATPAAGAYLLRSRVGRGCRDRSEEHTSELQSQSNLVCRLLLEKKKKQTDKARVAPTLGPISGKPIKPRSGHPVP